MYMYLAGEVCSTSLRHLKDDGRLGIASSLEGSYNGGPEGLEVRDDIDMQGMANLCS